METRLYKKIVSKKEFSELPGEDVEKAFSHFEKRDVSEDEKVRLTRELLHKVFSSFTSQKLLSLKNKEKEWILRKHLSTRERLPYYKEIYKKILNNFEGVVFDLGSGINGFSYLFFPKKIRYLGVEAVGQLVNQMKFYFEKNNFNAKAIHLSLFDLNNLKKIINKEKGKKIVFLFKVLDSLEMLEKDYSKKLLNEIIPLVNFVVVSFATQSMISRKKFNVSRAWILHFITENFKILNDFEFGGERYIMFSK